MKALIKVGYGCNDHCAFCHTLDVRHIDAEADEVRAKIHRAHALGHSQVVLSGGEPTIRPELVAWAELTASLGMGFGLVTNGRMLAYPEVVERLMQNRLEYVYLSLHGGTPRVHNLMVRSQAFEETYGALKNLTGKGLDLHVNCVITQQNMEHLRGVVDAMRPYPDAILKFSMVEPKGGGDKLFHRLMPRVSEVAAKVQDALAYADEQGVRAQHGALPLCLMKGFEAQFDDLKTHRFRSMIEVGEPDFFPVDDKNKLQPESTCAGCALRGPCPGLYRGYHEVFGDDELQAVHQGARSNSYDYVYEARVDADAKTCPLKDGPWGVTPWDSGRDLFVRHGARVARFRAESRDFSDEEMRVIKHELGQVYYDISRKDAPDDFARDLVKLRRSSLCDGCIERPHCAGLHEADLDDRFTEDDQHLRTLLRGLEGEVLDVGCGDAPYAEVFAAALAAGNLAYTGLEPDPERISGLQSTLPKGELVLGELSEAGQSPLGDREFDHVLVLRSWNHLPDPEQAAAALVRRLRPGGTLVVVDNVAFGLARTPAQTARAQSGAAGFEHHRNDDALAAAAYFEGLPLEQVKMQAVSPASSNQWMLVFRRIPNEAARAGAAE